MPYLPIESQLQDTTTMTEANVPPIEMLPEIARLGGNTQREEGGRRERSFLSSFFLPFFRPFSAPVNWGFLTALPDFAVAALLLV